MIDATDVNETFLSQLTHAGSLELFLRSRSSCSTSLWSVIVLCCLSVIFSERLLCCRVKSALFFRFDFLASAAMATLTSKVKTIVVELKVDPGRRSMWDVLREACEVIGIQSAGLTAGRMLYQ